MRKEHEYRKNAADTVELASRAGSSAEKGHLLRLAERWLDLAERAARMSFGPKRPDHPLVRKRLGGDQTNVNGPVLPKTD